MTDQQINEAIALALGWRYEPRQLKVANIPIEDNFPWINPQNERCRGPHVPNYCTDLNAMHEAEKTLHATNDWRILRAYFKWISPEIHEDWALDGDDWKLCHATARQRAEAFQRTIGKWKEESK